MSIKHHFRRLLWRLGYDISRFDPRSHPLARRKRLIEFYGINVVLDVGANTGRYGVELRNDVAFRGRIISFEPISSAYESLRQHVDKDPDWEAMHFALGDATETSTINIAGNLDSSSLLDMLPSHTKYAPESEYVGTETIETRTLDSIFADICNPGDSIYLKIDTQGFESRVLRGAHDSLEYIDTIQLEMSLVPLYEGEMLFSDMYSMLYDRGYRLVAVETGFSDRESGQLLQLDGVFHRFHC